MGSEEDDSATYEQLQLLNAEDGIILFIVSSSLWLEMHEE